MCWLNRPGISVTLGCGRIGRVVGVGRLLDHHRLTTASSDIETYDAAGRLVAMTLRAGWTYALAYGADGKLATVTDTFGGKLTF